MPRCKVVFVNDDYTPMEFVVAVLEDVFKMSREEATRAMLYTHRRGVFPVASLEEAEADESVRVVLERANDAGHPFHCYLETE